jgi:cysteine desulfurase/selenocysteine lyase
MALLYFETWRWSISFTLEHHSNIVPWQNVNEQDILKVIPMNDEGELIMANMINYWQQNKNRYCKSYFEWGTVNPIKYMIDKAHEVGAAVFWQVLNSSAFKPNMQELIVISMFSLDIKYVDQE